MRVCDDEEVARLLPDLLAEACKYEWVDAYNTVEGVRFRARGRSVHVGRRLPLVIEIERKGYTSRIVVAQPSYGIYAKVMRWLIQGL